MRRFVELWCAVAAFAVCTAHVASAGQQSQLGRTVTDVQVEISGVPIDDLNVISLIETRIGDALSMQAVRNTIDHSNRDPVLELAVAVEHESQLNELDIAIPDVGQCLKQPVGIA